MGIYDRGYFDGDDWRQPGTSPGNGSFSSAVKSIVIVNVVIFLLDMFSGAVEGSDNLRLSSFLGLKQGIAASGQPGPFDSFLYLWQLLSHGFAHASISSSSGIFHVLFNMLFLVMLGRTVERRYGSSEFLRFYLLAIVLSGLVWLLISAVTGRGGLMVGASGAVTAVVFLFVLNYPREILMIFGVIPAPAWVIGVLFLITDISFAFNRKSTIAGEAHLAGAAFAAAYFYGNWNFAWLQFKGMGKRLKRRPKLKVHAPEEGEDSLVGEADRVLEKLHQQGEASLTARERKVLEKYSRKVRQSRDS